MEETVELGTQNCLNDPGYFYPKHSLIVVLLTVKCISNLISTLQEFDFPAVVARITKLKHN